MYIINMYGIIYQDQHFNLSSITRQNLITKTIGVTDYTNQVNSMHAEMFLKQFSAISWQEQVNFQ